MIMFVVAEVHPFSDGNGRTARLAMNCMLSARALSRVQRWSAAFDYSLPRAQLRESLARCNAFQEDLRSYKLLFPTAKLAV